MTIGIDPIPVFDPNNLGAQRRLEEILREINLAIESLELTKVVRFNGTTDADSQTTFAHGLTAANILGAIPSINQSGGSAYILGDVGSGAYAAADAFRYYISGANFVFDTVGTNLQSQAYRVAIFYV